MKRGIPFGMMIGLSIVTFYVYIFFALGIYFVWQSTMPTEAWGWVKIALSSVLYLSGGVILFFPVVGASAVIFFRDRYIWKMGIPILITIVYACVPNIPGPIDEAVVFGIAYWIRMSTLGSEERKQISE